MFTQPDALGVGTLQPAGCYPYLFPPGRFDLNKISYYFDHDGPGMLPDNEYDEIFHAVGLWQDRWRSGLRPTLSYRKSCSSIFIEDGRNGEARNSIFGWRSGAL